jgi:hypothetical protein
MTQSEGPEFKSQYHKKIHLVMGHHVIHMCADTHLHCMMVNQRKPVPFLKHLPFLCGKNIENTFLLVF